MSICVYKLLCTANKRFYIGSTKEYDKRKDRHLRDLRAGIHNNIFLQRTFNKYGESAFKWMVIYVDTLEYARVLEQHYIDKYLRSKRCMNIGMTASGGDNLTRHPNRDDIIRRIANTVRETTASMSDRERKAKWGRSGSLNGMYGRTHTVQTRKLISRLNKGRAAPNKGCAMSDDQKRKLSASRMGKYKGADNPFYGKHHAQETKDILAAKARARNSATDYVHPQSRKVKCDGKVYKSVSEAARILGCVPASILFRIKSPNFKYSYM